MDPTAPNNNNGQNPPSVQPGQFVVAGDDTQASVATPSAPAQPQVPPSAPASGATQPDPTPFSPTPPGTPPAPQDPESGSSGGGGIKKILILLAVLALIGILAAVAYFFVMPMLNNTQEQTTTDELIEETTIPAQRSDTDTGFSEIPESTTTSETEIIDGTETTIPPETVVDPLTIPIE